MRRVTGLLTILIMASMVIACDSDLIGKADPTGKSEGRSVLRQDGTQRGWRHDARFKEMTKEERQQFFQKARENGEFAKVSRAERSARYIERLRQENPGMNDEQLNALAQERISARRTARAERGVEARENRRGNRSGREGLEKREGGHRNEGGRHGERGERGGKRAQGKGPKGA